MRIVPERIDSLPKLGWCIRVRSGEDDVMLSHGNCVELSPSAFFSGVWDGSFREWDLASATTVFGSGGAVAGDRLLICGASHIFEALFAITDRDVCWVSNSFAILLALTGARLDPKFLGYRSRLFTLWLGGIRQGPTRLPTLGGPDVLAMCARDVEISDGAELSLRDKRWPSAPRSFDEYRDLLTGSLARMVANGADPMRRQPLGCVATVSTGYDSVAVAALGKSAGVATAVTLEQRDPSGVHPGGSAVADALGMTVLEFDRDAWAEEGRCPEAEFVVMSSGPVMARLGVLAGRLPPSIVLVGLGGDQLWERTTAKLGDHLEERGGFVGGSCLQEFGIRAGFVFAPVPCIGAVNATAIKRMSRADEMRPWSVGGDYDRPVARRLAEEAGVPRDAFGYEKEAGTVVGVPEELSAKSKVDFEAFVTAASAAGSARLRWRHRVETKYLARATRRLQRQARRHGHLALARRIRLWRENRTVLAHYSLHWALGILVDRYQPNMSDCRKAD